MGDRTTDVHDDLSSEQRARLCIAVELIDVSTTELDGFDLLRYAHWVSTGQHPDEPQTAVTDPVAITSGTLGSQSVISGEIRTSRHPWEPAVAP